ncbi:MAG: four helix bundle protein [Wenzhouxiangella sp.]
MAMRFENLEVWKVSARLASDLYKTTRNLKDWGFRDQLTRAGLSISSNIAEGFDRESHRDCNKFLVYAKSSAAEVRSQLYIGIDIGFIDAEAGRNWIQQTEPIAAMLTALIKKRREFASQTAEEPAIYEND